MTEINTTQRANSQQQKLFELRQQQEQFKELQESREGDRPSRSDAARMSGLASGIDTEGILRKIDLVERRRMEPMQDQRFQTLQELESFGLIKGSLENIKATIDSLKSSATWEGKIVESSNEDVVTATATQGAKPGKNTLVVDRIALNHQIASQNYAEAEDVVGNGRFTVKVGEEGNPIPIVLDESNNTLTGLKDAINFATDELNATIIKTGNKTKPYQLVLTSQQTGSEGRITVEVDLQSGITPNFDNFVEDPSPWQGVGVISRIAELKGEIGTGASTAIVQVVGSYEGEDENVFTLTAIQSGVVGGDDQLQIRWADEDDRTGVLNLDKLNYAPGVPLEFVDGLALIFSEGEIIVNDSFSFTANPTQPDRFWWIDEEGRKSNTTTPTAWTRQIQGATGAPVIGGDYNGDDDNEYTLTISGSGQIGSAPNLTITWEDDDGLTGTLSVGRGYEPGTPLAINQGLTVTLKSGVLNDGQVATFEVEAEDKTNKWWLDDAARLIPPKIVDVTNWTLPDEVSGFMPALPEDVGARISTSQVALSGVFQGDEAKIYTFTALTDGAIGTTRGLQVKWEDDKGNFGNLNLADDYLAGTPLPFDSGLAIAFGSGRIFEEDFFTVRTRTATIQPPQDALIRFGATEFGGGLEITSSTNQVEGVIEGVLLDLHSTSEKPVTITVRGDKELARKVVVDFVEQYNNLGAMIAELSKFNEETNIAGPLLGDSDVIAIRNTLSRLLIDPVAGLPRESNTLFSLGIAINDQGLLEIDEAKLNNKINEDFGLVADLFRDKGTSDNNQVAFVGMTPATAINTDGYTIEITRPATQGHYISPPLLQPIVIDDTNHRFSVSVDGRQSEEMNIPVGSYSLPAYARLLQNAIASDKAVGKRGVRVLAEGDRIRLISSRFGSRSTISFVPGATGKAGVGLLEGQSDAGLDVEGDIDGTPGEGNGQLLRVPEKTGPASGLRLYVKLNEEQIDSENPEALVTITKGVASRVSRYLETLVNPLTGQMRRITKDLRDRVGELDSQLKRLEERIDRKRAGLRAKFNRLESKMSSLRSQQTFMQSQMAGMGGGGGLPGLPG